MVFQETKQLVVVLTLLVAVVCFIPVAAGANGATKGARFTEEPKAHSMGRS